MVVLVLFSVLEEVLSAFHYWYDVGCGFVINDLYYVEICFLYTHLIERFYHKSMLKFVREFPASFEMMV